MSGAKIIRGLEEALEHAKCASPLASQLRTSVALKTETETRLYRAASTVLRNLREARDAGRATLSRDEMIAALREALEPVEAKLNEVKS